MKPDGHATGRKPETYPVVMGYLPPKFVKKAEIELFEKPETMWQKVDKVRELIRNDAGIKEEWFKDDEIIMYLRCKKYDVDRAFMSLKKMAAFIQKHEQFFRAPDPEILRKVQEKGVFTIMPERDRDGCVVALVRLSCWNTMEISVDDIIKCCIFLTMPLLREPMTQVNGCKIIYDFDCNVLRYIRYCTPFTIYFIYQCLFECVPIRVKEVNAVNPTTICRMILSILHMTLSEKIKKRINFIEDMSKLTENLQPSVVPVSYGGELPDKEINFDWRKSLHMPDYVSAILGGVKSSSTKRADSH